MPIGDEWGVLGTMPQMTVLFKMATRSDGEKVFTVDASRKEHIIRVHGASAIGEETRFLDDEWQVIASLIEKTIMDPCKVRKGRQRRM